MSLGKRWIAIVEHPTAVIGNVDGANAGRQR